MISLHDFCVGLGLVTNQSPFDVFAEHLKAYSDEHGHCQVPQTYRAPDGYWLGLQVVKARVKKRKNKYTRGETAQLENLGLLWNGISWFPAFVRHWKEYQGQFEDSVQYVCPDGYQLGLMVDRIRRSREQNTFGGLKLTPEMTDSLTTSDFPWDPDVYWYKVLYQHLKRYTKSKGHCHTLSNYVCTDGYKLGQKIIQARARYKTQKPDIETVKKFEVLGFSWLRDRALWFEEFVLHLKEFKTYYGHCQVPQRYMCADGYQLGSHTKFMRNCRNGSGNSRLTSKMVDTLDVLGFVWWSNVYERAA